MKWSSAAQDQSPGSPRSRAKIDRRKCAYRRGEGSVLSVDFVDRLARLREQRAGGIVFGAVSYLEFRRQSYTTAVAAGRLNRAADAVAARADQASAQYKSAIANAFREVQDAIGAQGAARDMSVIEQRRVDTLTKTWNLAKLRYENGVASQLDVIDAERGLLQAEPSRIEAERSLRFAVADLYKALGTR